MQDGLKVPLRGALKSVWNVLVWHAGQRNECWPALDTIAMEAGLARSTTCSALTELERIGLISRDSPAGGKSTRYFIHCSAAEQLTVRHSDTKERERNSSDSALRTVEAQRRLEVARRARRRHDVKDAFLRLCAVLPPEGMITVPMLARELGARQPQVRADMKYLIDNHDLPFDLLGRFVRSKPNPKNFAKREAAQVLQFRRSGL